MNGNLHFEIEWTPAQGITNPETAATWARLEIWAGGRCVTRVEDRASESARRSIFGSAYPLAEWIAFNWWLLHHHTRPAALLPAEWSYDRLRTQPQHRHAWLRNHNLRAIGDGLSWPNLTVLPEGETTRLVWHADEEVPDYQPVRFLSEGDVSLLSPDVTRALDAVVQQVLTRLAEQRVSGTPLQKEWQALSDTDQEEAAFCSAAARLGLDPYRVDDGTAELMLGLDERLETELQEDFLSTVDAHRIAEGLEWIESAKAELRRWPSGRFPGRGTLPTSPAKGIPAAASQVGRPWKFGWQQAVELRRRLELAPDRRIETDDFVSVSVVESHQPRLEGLGGRLDKGGAGLVTGKAMHAGSRRFVQARALWNLTQRDSRDFLIVPGTTFRHRVERAFAAELLAPAEGVSRLIGDVDWVTEDQLDEAADHFGVSTQLVRHQVENQLGLSVALGY